MPNITVPIIWDNGIMVVVVKKNIANFNYIVCLKEQFTANEL